MKIQPQWVVTQGKQQTNSNKIFLGYTERRKAMNKKESKYTNGKMEEYRPKDESMRTANKEEMTEKKQIRRKGR